MPNLTYYFRVANAGDKVLILLHGEIKTPPMSREARSETGYLLRRLQQGELLSMPQSKAMQTIGARCRELRINDKNATWRVIYRIDDDAIVILEIFSKKTNNTPQNVIDACKRRIKDYDS